MDLLEGVRSVRVRRSVTGTPGTGESVLAGIAQRGAHAVMVKDGSCFEVGQVVQIGEEHWFATEAECRKIARIDGNRLEFESRLGYRYAAGVRVIGVTAPYTHRF